MGRLATLTCLTPRTNASRPPCFPTQKGSSSSTLTCKRLAARGSTAGKRRVSSSFAFGPGFQAGGRDFPADRAAFQMRWRLGTPAQGTGVVFALAILGHRLCGPVEGSENAGDLLMETRAFPVSSTRSTCWFFHAGYLML